MRAQDEGVTIEVRVIPRAVRSGVAGTRDGAVLVRLAAAPVDGAANAALVDVLAEAFDIPKRHVAIVSGERARRKRVRLAGVTDAQVQAVVSAGETT
ncbi:MAG: DUF167 domain-containing protein [Acidobacteria bacterium]|nr:DUF167 domain-containing protein [Acidobacteriota bacterium]